MINNIFELLKLLKIFKINNKIRLGNNYDGGYVISNLFSYDTYISAGIGDDSSFCKDFIEKYKPKKSYGFDATINNLPKNFPKEIEYVKKNIGLTNNENKTTILEILEKNKNIFLKMDIEGFEIDWFKFIDEKYLTNIKQMVVEFHEIQNNVDNLVQILNKISKTHKIIHIHGNNYGGYFDFEKIKIPNVLEITFINNDYLESDLINNKVLPCEIDYPNNPNVLDLNLNFYPFLFDKTLKKDIAKLYEFYGLRRSGLHAIMNWVLCNFTDCNNIKNFGNHLLYLDEVLFIDNYEDDNYEDILLVLDIVKPKIIFVLYEDKDFNTSLLNKINLNVKKKFKFTIYRSLKNIVASRLKYNQNYKTLELNLDNSFFNLWVETKNFYNSIYYDSWLVNKKYRNFISKKMSIKNKDITNKISFNGGGSSFVGLNLDTNKNLINRYKIINFESDLNEKIKSTLSRIDIL